MTHKSVSKGAAALLAIILSLTAFAAVPAAAEETTSDSISWGVEYDWSQMGEDFAVLTGLNIDEILDDIGQAADDADFDLLIAEVTSGTSRMYVTQMTGDQVSIMDADGQTHTVTEHITEMTIVHAVMADMIILMEWEDPDAGTDPEEDEDPTQQGAAMNIKLTGGAEQLAALDGRYVEYRNAANEVIGADSTFTAALSFGVGSAFDATLVGGDDKVDIDFAFDFSIGYELIDSNVKWRLHQPINAYNDLASITDGDYHSIAWICADEAADDENDGAYYDTHPEHEQEDWELSEDGEWVEVEGEETGRMMIVSKCGEIEGTYASEISYDFSLMGVPVELMGMETDVFNIDIQDTYQMIGEFDNNPITAMDEDSEGYFVCGDAIMYEQDPLEIAADPTETYTVTVDDAGTQVEAHRVIAPPIPGCMAGALGATLIASGMDIVEDADGIVEAVMPVFDDIEEEIDPTYGQCPAEWDEEEMIDLKLDDYNNGWSDCADRSDEPFEHTFECVNENTWYNEDTGEEETDTWSWHLGFYQVNDGWVDCSNYQTGKIHDEYVDMKFNCDNDHRNEDSTAQVINLVDVNDGNEDCANGNDEADDTTLFYACDDGQMVEWWEFKAAFGDACDDYSGNMDEYFCDNVSWHQVANGWEECEDGSDEPDDVAQCPSGYEYTSVNAFNDGKRHCWWDDHDDYDYRWVTDESYDQSFKCHNGDVVEIYQANDGIDDCADKSDEEGFTTEVLFTCLDGSTIPIERANDKYEDENGNQHGGEDCPDGSDEPEEVEPTSELMNVFTHILQSNIGDTMEEFAENLEETFEDVAVGEFPFMGGDATMLYDPLSERTIGMLVFVDEDVNGDDEIDLDTERFILIGPVTEGYTQAPHSLSFTYLVGSAASDAQDAAEDVDDITDVVDPATHNTDDLDAIDDGDFFDDDGDGVPNLDDQCQTTPADSIVGADGCMLPDADGDGVADADDACADTVAGAAVGADGCVPPPPDADGDGVTDADDACADTKTGVSVDADGCKELSATEEEAGLLPSISLIATIGILALAGLVAVRRD